MYPVGFLLKDVSFSCGEVFRRKKGKLFRHESTPRTMMVTECYAHPVPVGVLDNRYLDTNRCLYENIEKRYIRAEAQFDESGQLIIVERSTTGTFGKLKTSEWKRSTAETPGAAEGLLNDWLKAHHEQKICRQTVAQSPLAALPSFLRQWLPQLISLQQ